MLKQLGTSVLMTIVLCLICCGIYPLAVWAVGQTFFHSQANGSLIRNKQGVVIGSRLIGQNFSKPIYFWPRQSAAGGGYDPTQSGATNLGPTSAKLINGSGQPTVNGKPNPNYFPGVLALADQYRQQNNLPPGTPVPVDAVTRSGSGLDPHISPENAKLQAPRVAQARNMPLPQVMALVQQYTAGRSLGFMGEPGVNVLELNLALDKAQGQAD